MKKIFFVLLLYLTLGLAACGDKEIGETDASNFNYSIDNGVVSINGLKNKELNEFRIPEQIDGFSVTTISDEAFSESRIELAVIPASVKKIGTKAFYLSSVSELRFIKGSQLEEIGESAFRKCYNLRQISLGEKVTRILEDAFFEMYGLEKINVDKNNTTYKSIDGVLYSADESILYLYPSAKYDDFSFSSKINEIASKAFHSTAVTDITLPGGVKKIGDLAFKESKRLHNLVLPEGLEEIGSNFIEKTSIRTLVIPSTVTKMSGSSLYAEGLYKVTFLGNVPEFDSKIISFQAALIVKDDVFQSYYDNYAFNNQKDCLFKQGEIVNDAIIRDNVLVRYVGNASTYTVPSGIARLEKNAFRNSNLISITLNDELREIGEYCFSYTAIGRIDLKNVTTLEKYSLGFIIALERVFVSNNIETIDSDAFGLSGDVKIDIYFEASEYSGSLSNSIIQLHYGSTREEFNN